MLFSDPHLDALAEAMADAAARSWDTARLQRHAGRWSEEVFADRLRLLADAFPNWCRRCGGAGLGPRPLEALLEMRELSRRHDYRPGGIRKLT